MAFNWVIITQAADRRILDDLYLKELETRFRRLQAQKQGAANRPVSERFTAEMKAARVANIQSQMDDLEAEHDGIIVWRDGGGTGP